MKTTLLAAGDGRRLPAWLELIVRWSAAPRRPRPEINDATASRQLRFSLDHGSLWRLDGNVRGLRIDCREGWLWLTQSGMAADVVLSAGECHTVGQDGRILIQSLWDAPTGVSTAHGTLIPAPHFPMPAIHRSVRAPSLIWVGRDRIPADRHEFWEQIVWMVLWISGAFSVGWWLKTVLQLSWPH